MFRVVIASLVVMGCTEGREPVPFLTGEPDDDDDRWCARGVPDGAGGREVPRSVESPSGSVSRPWILRFARVPDRRTATPVPVTFYSAEEQISLRLDGGLLPYMGTHKPTVPDGNPANPPPLDEGEKD